MPYACIGRWISGKTLSFSQGYKSQEGLLFMLQPSPDMWSCVRGYQTVLTRRTGQTEKGDSGWIFVLRQAKWGGSGWFSLSPCICTASFWLVSISGIQIAKGFRSIYIGVDLGLYWWLYKNAKQLSVKVSFELKVVSFPAEQIFSYFTGYRENILSCA